jgi:hypothetical protein
MLKSDPIIKRLDILPMVQHYISELGLYKLFEEYIPNTTGCDINPSQVLCMMIMNIIVACKPLYKVDDWLLDYLDGQSEQGVNAGKYNDDRLGRTLDKLFEADRNVLMSKSAVAAIKVHKLQTDRIHNDSTTVSFAGTYSSQNTDAVEITYGHNKDHRPDYKHLPPWKNLSNVLQQTKSTKYADNNFFHWFKDVPVKKRKGSSTYGNSIAKAFFDSV